MRKLVNFTGSLKILKFILWDTFVCKTYNVELKIYRGNHSKHQANFFWKSVSLNSRKRWRKLWITLSKFSQKIRRYRADNTGGTLSPLFFSEQKKKKGKQSLSNQLKNWKFITLAVYFEERGWAKKTFDQLLIYWKIQISRKIYKYTKFGF